MSTFEIEHSVAAKWIQSFPLCVVKELRARLICFHWAGGNGLAFFKPWARDLAAFGIEVRSIMLPSRMGRSKEAFVTDVRAIVGKTHYLRFILFSQQYSPEKLHSSMISLQLTGENQPPTVFFGHSYNTAD